MLEIMVLIVFGAICLFGVSVGIFFLTMSNFMVNRIFKKTMELQKKIMIGCKSNRKLRIPHGVLFFISRVKHGVLWKGVML